jgi:branched-chain amino acid transport system permease protein
VAAIRPAPVLGVLVLLVLPLFATDAYLRHLLVLWMLFALMALSLNIILGYLGELSFGHAAFFGLGAYASAMATVYGGMPFAVGLLAAGLSAAVAGAVIGWIALRIKGPQFAIMTLAFGAILHSVFVNWVDVTNGPLGITRIPPPDLPVPGVDFGAAVPYYYLVVAFVLGAAWLSRAILASRTGRAFAALRGDDALAASIGIDVFAHKLLGFTLATAVVGVAGSLYAHYLKIITPDLFTLPYMAAMVIMVIIGGKGTIVGPILGAALYVGLLEVLRASGSMRMFVFAVLLTLCVIFLPGGLASLWPRLVARFGGRAAPGGAR